MKDNVTDTPEEPKFIKTLPPERQKTIHEMKKDYPGWIAVPDSNAKLTGYAWMKKE